MPKVKYRASFEGRVDLEFDTDDYPHYFRNDEARGGEEQLAKDLFYDYAYFQDGHHPFKEGTSEIRDGAFLDKIEGQ